MNPADSPDLFRERLIKAGLSSANLTPAGALGQMMSFYREVRAEDCVLDSEGDMLLFAWGTHDWGAGPAFHIELARQFIQPGDEDEDGMSQFFVRLHYPVSEVLFEIGEGEHWCESPHEADAFEEFVLANPAYRALVEQTPTKLEMDWVMV